MLVTELYAIEVINVIHVISIVDSLIPLNFGN